jgi:hypothetical protein
MTTITPLQLAEEYLKRRRKWLRAWYGNDDDCAFIDDEDEGDAFKDDEFVAFAVEDMRRRLIRARQRGQRMTADETLDLVERANAQAKLTILQQREQLADAEQQIEALQSEQDRIAWREWASKRAGGGMTLQDGDATMRQAIDELLEDRTDALRKLKTYALEPVSRLLQGWRTWAADVLGVEPGLSDDELRKRLSAELSCRPEKLGYVLCPDCSPEPDGLVARPGAIIGGRVCCWRCGMAAVAVNESTKGEVEA